MNISIKKIEVEMDGDTAYHIACRIITALKAMINDHYCNFEDRVFLEQESKDIRLITQFKLSGGIETTFEKEQAELLEYLAEKRKQKKERRNEQ